MRDKVQIKSVQRKKTVRTDMPGLAEQLKVGRITLWTKATLMMMLVMFFIYSRKIIWQVFMEQ